MNLPTVQHVIVENERLRRENERMRHALKLRDGRHVKRVRRAYSAALALASLHVGYSPTDRETAQRCGLTQRQWENGTALLRMARVMNGRRWQIHDMASIDTALHKAAQRAIKYPEAFRSWLPRHALR